MSKRDNDANIHPALGELKAQVMMGRHYEGEYLALEKQYKRQHLAYFKEVDDGQGGTVPEGRKNYNETYAQVHGATKAAMQSQRPTMPSHTEPASSISLLPGDRRHLIYSHIFQARRYP